MKRRNLLRSIGMLPLLSSGLATLFSPMKAAKAVATRTKQRVRPSDSSWPAAAEAFALVIIADGEAPAYSGLSRTTLDLAAARQDARAIDRATAELRKIAPNAGSYVSESNYFNRSWQNGYWGKNYPRLRAIKAKYDPDGLFFVHHGVGSEEWSADGFTRLA
jgi:FAD/FMN-containing dehydrogenase